MIDHDPMSRHRVAGMLSKAPNLRVVAEGASADDAVAFYFEHRPDLMLLDLHMPGGGHAALAAILDADPEFPVIALTGSQEDGDLIHAYKVGVRGYLPKRMSASMLIEAITSVKAGESYVSPTLAGKALRQMCAPWFRQTQQASSGKSFADLTIREEQILTIVAAGHTNKEVGIQLDLQEATVKHYMTRILLKLNARNRTEAARLFQNAALGLAASD